MDCFASFVTLFLLPEGSIFFMMTSEAQKNAINLCYEITNLMGPLLLSISDVCFRPFEQYYMRDQPLGNTANVLEKKGG